MDERIRRSRYLTRYTPHFKELHSPGKEAPYNDQLYTCSKFGGLEPFFNPDAHWPLCQSCERPQTFIGQVNLEETGIPLPIREKLAEHGGKGIFQVFCCASDNLTSPECTLNLRAFFVTPRPATSHHPLSLTDLAVRRIANEIIQESPTTILDNHQILVELPEHLQTPIKNLVLQDRAEKTAANQREYCVDALKDVKKFIEFDSRKFGPNTMGQGVLYDGLGMDEKLGDGITPGQAMDIEDLDWRILYYKFQGKPFEWKSSTSEIDDIEADYNSELWLLDGTSPVDDHSIGEDEDEDEDEDEYEDGGRLSMTFLGWPEWNPMFAGMYPLCPTNDDHGPCYEMIFTTYNVEEFDPGLSDDGGWLMILKCPQCSSFAASLENPCLH